MSQPELRIGDTVRQEFDDGSLGAARIIAIAMDMAWCFYAEVNCHRVHSLKRLEAIYVTTEALKVQDE